MERKRDGLMPIGDIAGAVELPDGRALTPAAPPALHHFHPSRPDRPARGRERRAAPASRARTQARTGGRGVGDGSALVHDLHIPEYLSTSSYDKRWCRQRGSS